MRLRAGVIAVASLVCVASVSPASAVERENQVGVDVGGALLVISDKSTNDLGATAGAHYTYGLSDAFNLMVEGSFSLVALDQTADSKKTPQTYPSWLANADVGLAYVFDVLQWVPYAGILVGGYALSGGTLTGPKILPGAAIAIGVDYRLNPNLSVGIAARQHMVTETSTYPSFTQVLARVEYTWGW